MCSYATVDWSNTADIAIEEGGLRNEFTSALTKDIGLRLALITDSSLDNGLNKGVYGPGLSYLAKNDYCAPDIVPYGTCKLRLPIYRFYLSFWLGFRIELTSASDLKVNFFSGAPKTGSSSSN